MSTFTVSVLNLTKQGKAVYSRGGCRVFEKGLEKGSEKDIHLWLHNIFPGSEKDIHQSLHNNFPGNILSVWILMFLIPS